MKEFFTLLFKFDTKGLFIKDTDNTIVQFFRYCFVGGLAFAVDYATLYIFKDFFGLHYLIAAAIAFILGLITNFTLSKKFIFQKEYEKGKKVEFIAYLIIGALGLGLTVALMYLFTEIICLYYMISKAIAAVIVLIWNFFMRKIILYRR